MQEDTGPPMVPELPFGFKKLKRSTATMRRDGTKRHKVVNEKEALAFKAWKVERRYLRLINKGRALLRHVANPPEVTPTVQIHEHKHSHKY